jgi:hypothetical protein
MIMLTLLVLAIFNLSAKGKLQLIVSYSIKTLSIYSVSIQTILTIPFLTVFYSAIYCNESSQLSGGFNCYESIYYLHFTIGVNGARRNTLTTKIVGLILFICLLIFFTLFQVDVNPASSSP